jgi:hypothetical protein
LVFQGGALSLSSTLDSEEKFLLLKHGKKVAMDLQTFLKCSLKPSALSKEEKFLLSMKGDPLGLATFLNAHKNPSSSW